MRLAIEEAYYRKMEDISQEIIEVDEIINVICESKKINIDEIHKRSRSQEYSDIRKSIGLLSDKYANATATELAKQLNIPSYMVSRIKSGTSKKTKYVEEIININKFENKEIIQA